MRSPKAWLAVLLALALVACSTPQAELPTPVPTFEVADSPTAGAATPEPTAETVVQSPTTAVEPTSTPTPATGPTLVDIEPALGQELALDGTITLVFSEAMDHASVEEAIQFDPVVSGAFDWGDDDTQVTIQPEAGALTADSEYRMSLRTSAASAAGDKLAQPRQWTIYTTGTAHAVQTTPSADAIDVAVDSVLRVAFDRPVVPLVGVSEQANLPSPISVSPEIEGSGAWINTSIYEFTPVEGWLGGSTYTVTTVANPGSPIVAEIDELEWSFVTQLPQVTSIFPAREEQYTDPDSVIELTFNQPMAQEETEALLTVQDGDTGKAVAGKMSWEENTLVFTPTKALTRGATIEVLLEAGAPAASREVSIASDYSARFRVSPKLALESSSPKNGAKDVSYSGSLQLSFSCPIDRDSLKAALEVDPEGEFYIWTGDTDTQAYVSLNLSPSTKYSLTIGSELEDVYGETLGKDLTIAFTTEPREPDLWLLTPSSVGLYDAYGDPTVYASGVNISSATFELYDIGERDFVSLVRDGTWPDWDDYKISTSDLLRKWTVKLDGDLNEVVGIKLDLTEVNKGTLDPGYYLLRATASGTGVEEYHLLVVSPYNLVLKTGGDEALIWATDVQSGQPVADLDFTVYDSDGKNIAEGTTDNDGVATVTIGEHDAWEALTVLGAKKNVTGAVLRGWNEGISAWSFDVPIEMYPEQYRVYLYSDRQIYRPGQTVYYKGFVRADDDGTYSLPLAGMEINAEFYDSQGRLILEDQLTLSENGTFDGAVLLSEDATLGYYWAAFEIGKQYPGLSFLVAEYRKPEFQGEITLDATDYVPGDTAVADVSAGYFFGGAVTEGQVVWNAYKEPYTPSWAGLEDYTFSDQELSEWPYIQEYGGPVADGTGETDDEGHYLIELPVDLSEDTSSQQLLVSASVIDANNQEVAVSGSAILHKALVYAGLNTDAYVGTAGEQMGVTIATVDIDGQPVADQDVEVTFYKHEWYSVKEEDDDGNSFWSNESRETEVDSASVTSDEEGLATASFTPEDGGTYRVRTTVLDEQGNENHSSLYLWVSSGSFVNWGQSDDHLMELVADKNEYEVGDVAQVLLPVPYDVPMMALLTIERGGVLEHSLLELDGASQIIEIPILESYVPDVFVSVTLIAGSDALDGPADIKVGYVELPVSIASRELEVSIEPAQDTYKPRDEAEFTITTRDADGDPVSAEVSLQLVDLAVETLVGGTPASILQTFYRERGLGVSTAASLTASVDRANIEYAAEGKGGGGGGDGGFAAREYFPDTAYWQATLITDDAGQATVSIVLPDSLTTWRMHAQAMTLDSLVGSTQADIVTNLDLMVRPSLPRFLVTGDEPELTAVVHNNTAKSLDIDVSLSATGGVEIDDPEQTVRVAAGDKATVVWSAKVTGTDTATFTTKAEGGGLTDAVITELSIEKPITPEVVATSGQVDDRVTEQLQVPLTADADWGAMVMLLEPSLAAGMTEGLRYLRQYPYACAEQTISRFYPNVVTYRALQELGVERADLEATLPQQVGVGLQRLYETQNLDGGWGWWASGTSDATITAYAVAAMTTAKEAGFAVDQTSIDLAVGFLQARLDEDQIDSRQDRDERAAVLYALALAGEGDLGRTINLFEEREGLSVYARAYVAKTLFLLDDPDSTRLQTLTNEFEAAAILSGANAHWEDGETSPWSMSTDTRTTAMVLSAMVQLSPDSQTLPAAVRWLMTARSAGRWETTQENAWAIMALTDYMVMTGELQGDYDYQVSLNGDQLDEGEVTPETVDQVIVEQVAMPDLARDEMNSISVSRSEGDGKLYYSAYLNYYLPVDQIYPLSRGVYVQREYTYQDAAGDPVDEPVLNGLIEVKLTIIAPQDLYYVIIEDALPAGCEAIDPSLDISRETDVYSGLAPVGEPEVEGPYWRQTWPTHAEFQDERVALFARELGAGTYEYAYTMRCSAAGTYNVLPVLAYEMYAPDVMGRSAGEQLVIAR